MSGKNSEGYSDPTASIAISRATRKENKMDTARPGEIWIVQSTQGESPALILADNGRIATYIKLREGCMDDTDVRIVYQGKMYASPAMIQYTRSENCVGYKKTITDAEYDAVRQAIADALGIVLAELAEIDTSESWKLRDKIHSLEISLARCEGERDVYKELFTGGCNE
jgi:hypothetical protein